FWADLSISGLLLGVALAQWATYIIILKPFVVRKVLDTEPVVHSHIAHALVALLFFAISALVSWFLSDTSLSIQVAVQLLVVLGLLAFYAIGWTWFPANLVLRRRLLLVLPSTSRWRTWLRVPSTS